MTRLPRRHTLSCLLATAVLLAGAATPVLAQDGAYIVEPWRNGSYEAVQIQPDQKIVAAGHTYDFGENQDRFAIARYDSLGNLDATFGVGGLSTPALGPSFEAGYSLVLQSNGKAVVAGTIQSGGSSSSSDLCVARFNANGSLDSSFSGDGWTSFGIQSRSNDYANAVGLQSTGKVVAAGLMRPFNGGESLLVARFRTDGAIDSGTGGFGQLSKKQPTGYTLTPTGSSSSWFNGLAVQPLDDKIVVVGHMNVYAGGTQLVVARYTAAGILDTSFNGTGSTVLLPAGFLETGANEVALQSDGKIIVVGWSTGIDGRHDMFVARFNANGTLDVGFGGGSGYVRLDIDGTNSVTDEIARGVVIQPDGKIVAAGGVFSAGRAGVLVARFNQDGTTDSTFGGAGFKTAFPPTPPPGQSVSFRGNAVALQADGTIIVAGWSEGPEATDSSRPLLVRFLGW